MKKLYITVLIAVCSLFAFNSMVHAQEEISVPIQKEKPALQTEQLESEMRWFDRRKYLFLNQVVWSFSLSTTGVGAEGTTALSDKVYLRVGADFLPNAIGVSDKIAVNDVELVKRVGYIPDYHVDFKPQLLHGHILINYHPGSFFNNFHLTAGIYVGVGDIKAKGQLKNPATGENTVLLPQYHIWPTLVVEKHRLNIEGGKLNATIRMGEIVKPYIGIGFSRTIPKYKNDWGFNWDLGILVQPTFNIIQGGKKVERDYSSSAIDISGHLNRVKVWPVMSFRVSYRTK